MTRAVNDATLQKAGDIYQYLIALRDCFELNDGDTLQIVILSILVDTFISKISLPMQPVPEIGSISVA